MKVKTAEYTCPAAKTTMNVLNIIIPALALYIKFLFIFDPSPWIEFALLTVFAYYGYENYLEVLFYIWYY